MSVNRQQKIRRFINYYREQLLAMWETEKYELLTPIE